MLIIEKEKIKGKKRKKEASTLVTEKEKIKGKKKKREKKKKIKGNQQVSNRKKEKKVANTLETWKVNSNTRGIFGSSLLPL